MTCACAGASAFLFLVNPNRHAVYPQCLLHRMTGLYCAGCGATRALYALLHGRVLEAIHDNALFVGALPFLLALAGFYLTKTWRANAWPRLEISPGTVALRGLGIFLVMVVFTVVRNLPGSPFEMLRPLGG
jgi:hypothetical protein